MLFSTKLCPTLFLTPQTVAHQAPLPMGFPSKKTGVGCYFLLQGIFLTQGSNPSLLYCRRFLYYSANTTEKPHYKLQTLVKIMDEYWLITYKECITLMQDVNSRKNCVQSWNENGYILCAAFL